MEQFNQSKPASLIDPIEIEILNTVLLCASSGKPLLASDLCVIRRIASPATIHNRLTKLVKKKFITHTVAEDARKKYLELAPLGLEYTEGFGRCIIKACQ
jgi:DNA-binding MarR family transcriptional regulator